MKSTPVRLDQALNATNLWRPVNAAELTQIEGGLFGISWSDVKKAAKYVAGVIVGAIVSREVQKHT
jgi:hypothetical protein